jgi:hypothetical protein
MSHGSTNRRFVQVWLDSEQRPDSFLERFEMQKTAESRAERHLLAHGDAETGPDWKHPFMRLLHPFGFHEWVKVLVYDFETDRIIDPGQGRVICRNCTD